MDNQGISFLPQTNSFGIQQASVISNETADLLFGGGSTASDPNNVTPLKKNKFKPEENKPELIEEENNDTQNNRQPFDIKAKFTADDLLNSLQDDKEDTISDPTKQTPTAKEIAPTNTETADEETYEDNTFLNLTKELVKAGIFKDRDEDSTSPINTPEAFKERWTKEKQEQTNNEIYNFIMSKHGEEGLEAFDAIFVKGISPKDYLTKFAEVQRFENIDLSIEDNQKSIFREAYRRQGLSEDKIERKLQRTIDYGDLEEETRDLHEVLLKQEREDMNDKVAQAAEQANLQMRQKNEYLNNLNLIIGDKLKQKEFDGIPVTDKIARETYEYLTKENWVLPSGEKLTDFDKDILELRDPKNHELKVKLGLLLKNKLDLSKLKNKIISTDSNRVFDSLVKRDTQIRRTNKTASILGKSFLDNL